VFDLLDESAELRERVMANAKRFRAGMQSAGFTIKDGIHPIVPVMIGDAKLAQDMAARLLDEGIYVIGFSYPVVPKGEARIRVQLSAQHEPAQVDQAIAAFTKVGRATGVLG
jgi:glycine C-acetyltransferase